MKNIFSHNITFIIDIFHLPTMANRWYLKTELVSHTRKVLSLYRRMSRDIEYWEMDFFEARLKKLLLRQQFDKNKDIKDMRLAKATLERGEKWYLKNAHLSHINEPPMLHPFSKNGISYGRELLSPDYVMDWYHPLEKAQYPYYYAKREQMKDEYIALWNKKMLKPYQVEAETNRPPRS